MTFKLITFYIFFGYKCIYFLYCRGEKTEVDKYTHLILCCRLFEKDVDIF
jgi:hypothetical protein